MSPSLFGDMGFQSAKIALDGLSVRQQAISNNLSNVDTPGYKARTVKFEDTLQRALGKSKQKTNMNVTQEGHIKYPAKQVGIQQILREGGSERADGNNVDIDTELIDMTEAGIRYQTISQLVSKKLVLLRTISMSR